jgi:hypothetical protein
MSEPGSPCEICGANLPAGTSKAGRRIRGAHFQAHARERAAPQAKNDHDAFLVASLDELDRLDSHVAFTKDVQELRDYHRKLADHFALFGPANAMTLFHAKAVETLDAVVQLLQQRHS